MLLSWVKQHIALQPLTLPSFYQKKKKKFTLYKIIILQSKVITEVHSTLQVSSANRQCFIKKKKVREENTSVFSFSRWKNSNKANPLICGKCYLASRKSGPWDDSMKMESSTEWTACTWWVILPSSSANSVAPHSATRALNLLYTCTQLAVHSTAHRRRGLKIISLN